MKNLAWFVIVLISFCAAVGLGMADRETKSLVHLFTAETGNLVTIALITTVLSAVGCFAWYAISKTDQLAIERIDSEQ